MSYLPLVSEPNTDIVRYKNKEKDLACRVLQCEDLTVYDDLTVTDDVSVGGDLAVTGTITAPNVFQPVAHTYKFTPLTSAASVLDQPIPIVSAQADANKLPDPNAAASTALTVNAGSVVVNTAGLYAIDYMCVWDNDTEPAAVDLKHIKVDGRININRAGTDYAFCVADNAILTNDVRTNAKDVVYLTANDTITFRATALIADNSGDGMVGNITIGGNVGTALSILRITRLR